MDTYTYEWTNPGPKSKIELTVALPLKNMESIVWLALESLRRQRAVNFGWELVVFEDYDASLEVLKRFVGKLPGCQRIYYKAINPRKDGRENGRVYLIDKWIGIAKAASTTSNIFVMQAGDVYSPSKSLRAHYENFKHPECLISMHPRGVFYHMKLRKAIFYDGYIRDGISKRRPYFISMHLHMAIKTKDVAKMKPIDRNRTIDKYLKQTIFKMHKVNPRKQKVIFSAEEVFPHNWQTGFNTDGLNTISYRRNAYLNPAKMWRPHNKRTFEEYQYKKAFMKSIPLEVRNFLVSKRSETSDNEKR